MPRFPKRRMRTRRKGRSRRTGRTGRSRRGGAITIPNTGLEKPMTIYYSSRSENPSKKVTLKTILTNNLKTPLICEIVDINNKAIYEDCNRVRDNGFSVDDYVKIQEQNRQNLLEFTKADNDPIVNKANQMFINSPGVNDRYDDTYGGSKRIKRRKTQRRRCR